MNRIRPILRVRHEYDDEYWQFLCGYPNHNNSNIRIISLEQVTEIDPSVNDLYEMPLGFGAERKSINDKWELFKISN